MREFIEFVRNIQNARRVAIDISTFTKPYFLAALRALKDFVGIMDIDVFYTEPSEYLRSPGGTYEFSVGRYEPIEIPGYTGTRTTYNKRLLIILLGFDGNASEFISEELQPSVTIPINGFPSYLLHYKDVSVMTNSNLLTKADVRRSMRFAPANDPFETYNSISNICKDYENHAITIAPLGSKPMTLGAALYALRNPSVRIVYALPEQYRDVVTRKCGTTWKFHLHLNAPFS
jgi:hypothetical protein